MQKYFYTHNKRRKYKIKSEINVTPFVDVMLVLLIIFMLTSHMVTSGIDIDLPTSGESFTKKEEYINISINKKSEIYLQESVVAKEELVKKIAALLKEKPKTQILLNADKEANYGEVINIFSTLRQASIHNVTLITEEQY
ncbi:ExbD/TolR family protein [Candidatus Bandiella euplotis]|uniref:Tol-Pal system subunit TolR n=1 Tax=Candidatus Bandiella euplotis TaxID=1664265 RepID=A0ABZ0UM44_9RICK|nr:ExbD/TolR family protein [Candidatus Bandiella woodruffii]WPX97196.1 Tol-Pal system subunit TolR [Candidatus Bandiella woodruffii]